MNKILTIECTSAYQKSITNKDHEACPGEHAGIF